MHGENVHVQRLSASVSAVKQTSWLKKNDNKLLFF